MPGTPGLHSGFVRFGTTAHKILLLLHEHGRLMHSDFLEEKVGTSSNIGMALTRLRRFGFIFPAGKISKYETGAEKTQMVYSLHSSSVNRLKYAPATQAAKDARRKKSARVRKLQQLWFPAPVTLPQLSAPAHHRDNLPVVRHP